MLQVSMLCLLVQVDELVGILDSQGPEFLETYRVRGLTWEEVKELKGPELVGLGLGEGPAPGLYSEVAAEWPEMFCTTTQEHVLDHALCKRHGGPVSWGYWCNIQRRLESWG